MSRHISAETYTDLCDVTFAIPFRMDSAHRRRNLHIIVAHLTRHFRTNIIIAEHDKTSSRSEFWHDGWPPFVRHLFVRTESWYFQRSRCLNAAAHAAETSLLIMQDTDAYVPAGQYLRAAELLRNGACELAFPYENRVMWVPDDFVPVVKEQGVGELHQQDIPVSGDNHTIVSLAVIIRKSDFLAAGMMNEYFKSWGYEDVEFYERIRKLGYRCRNVEGLVYHLDHPRGANWGGTAFFEQNRREYEKVRRMGREELCAYVESWPWLGTRTTRQSSTHTWPSIEQVVGIETDLRDQEFAAQ